MCHWRQWIYFSPWLRVLLFSIKAGPFHLSNRTLNHTFASAGLSHPVCTCSAPDGECWVPKILSESVAKWSSGTTVHGQTHCALPFHKGAVSRQPGYCRAGSYGAAAKRESFTNLKDESKLSWDCREIWIPTWLWTPTAALTRLEKLLYCCIASPIVSSNCGKGVFLLREAELVLQITS